jgi:hypothetical protein
MDKTGIALAQDGAFAKALRVSPALETKLWRPSYRPTTGPERLSHKESSQIRALQMPSLMPDFANLASYAHNWLRLSQADRGHCFV